MTMPDFTANVTSPLDGAILMNSAPGVDAGPRQGHDRGGALDYPNVTVNDPADITEKAQHSVDQLLGIVTALLLLAVVVAILGIVNTLVLSVVERTRELGLLRAVGATRHQVRVVVRRESLLMALLGASTGIALGTVSGLALSRALADEGITTVAVPVWTLAGYLVVAAVVGVLAAIGPARRAAGSTSSRRSPPSESSPTHPAGPSVPAISGTWSLSAGARSTDSGRTGTRYGAACPVQRSGDDGS